MLASTGASIHVEQVLHAVRRGCENRSPSGNTGEPARCSFRPRFRYGCAKKNDARPGNLPAGRELLAVVRLYVPGRLRIASPVSPAVLPPGRASKVNLEARSTSDSTAPR